MDEESEEEKMLQEQSLEKTASKKASGKVRIGKRCFVGEHAVPEARWIEGAECPVCGGEELMDAMGMALCIRCNKFVKPKKKV
jgi:hypothetical protein